MDPQSRHDIQNALIMAGYDGAISPEEQEYIDGLRRKMGIAETEFEELRRQAQERSTRLSVPHGPRGRQTLQLLVETALADGDVNDRERRVLQKVARYLDLDDSYVDEALSASTRHDAQDDSQINEKIEQVYNHFADWDESTRRQKIEEIAAYGPAAVVPLLILLESYRTPEGCDSNVPMKVLVAYQLGQMEDVRAVYYLAQQVSIGDQDDEITSAELRAACAEAVARIVGEDFGTGDQAIETVREWWKGPGQDQYTNLVL